MNFNQGVNCGEGVFIQIANIADTSNYHNNMRKLFAASREYIAMIQASNNGHTTICKIFDIKSLHQETNLLIKSNLVKNDDDREDDEDTNRNVLSENMKYIGIRDSYGELDILKDNIYNYEKNNNNTVVGIVASKPRKTPVRSIDLHGINNNNKHITHVLLTETALHIILALDNGTVEVWDSNLSTSNQQNKTRTPILLYQIMIPDKTIVGLSVTSNNNNNSNKNVIESFSITILSKKHVIVVDLKKSAVTTGKKSLLPSPEKTILVSSMKQDISGYDGMEKLNNETRKLKGYIYRGLTQHSFLQNNIDETTSYYAKIKRAKGSKVDNVTTLGRPVQDRSIVYTPSPRKPKFRSHLKQSGDNKSYMKQPSVVIFSKNMKYDKPLYNDQRRLKQDELKEAMLRSKKLTNDFLNYSNEIVKKRTNDLNNKILSAFGGSKSTDLGGKQFSMPDPLFLMSALVSRVPGNTNDGIGGGGMEIVYKEIEEKKTMKDRVEERHAKYYHNVIKGQIHNHTVR